MSLYTPILYVFKYIRKLSQFDSCIPITYMSLNECMCVCVRARVCCTCNNWWYKNI